MSFLKVSFNKVQVFCLCAAISAVFSSGQVRAQTIYGAEIITHRLFGEGLLVTRAKMVPMSGVVSNIFFYNRADEPWNGQNIWYEYDWELRGKSPTRGWSQIRVRDIQDTPLRDAPVDITATVNLGDDFFNYILIRKDDTYVYDIRRTFSVTTYDYTNPNAHDGNTESLIVGGARIYQTGTGDGVAHIPGNKRLDLSLGITAFDNSFSGPVPAGSFRREFAVDYTRFYEYIGESVEATPVWQDEFNNGSLDFSKWYAANWPTFVTQFTPSNVQFVDGTIRLVINREGGDPVDPDPVDPDPVDPTFPTPTVPARIEAEDFVDSFDATPGNQGNAACGTGDVDAQFTGDVDGFCNIGWTSAGEWLEYEVYSEGGEYDLVIRAASGRAGRTFSVFVDGTNTGGSILVNALGWQTYESYTLPVVLSEGNHVVRILFDNGSVNLNYLEFIDLSGEPPSDPVDPSGPGLALPARIEAEQFTNSFDASSGNQGNAACGTGDVDSQITGDIDGFCNIAWTVAGEWLEYEVYSDGGEYELIIRAASGRTNKTLVVQVDGVDVGDSIIVNRGGWQSYDDYALQVALSPGVHTIRVVFETGDVNVNYLEFSN